MNKNLKIVLIFCVVIILISCAGCIEGHTTKTETVVTKLDSREIIQWTTIIENTGYSTSQSVAPTNRFIQTSDKGFFIAGFFSGSSGGSGTRILKTDSGGNLEWERRVSDQYGEIFFIIQRNDGGYSVFCRDGRVYNFGPAGTLEGPGEIHTQINRTPGGGDPVVTLRSITRTHDGNLIVAGDNYANMRQPVLIARLSGNGTVLGEKTYSRENMGSTTSLLQTQDGGLLLGKFFYRDGPGGGKQLQIEKTDANVSMVWDSSLGICNFTFCNNDLLGMHESADGGYDIVYQSHEQSNRSRGNMPVTTVQARLNDKGRIIQQEILTNVSGLPSWIFYQGDISSELISLVPEKTMNAIIADKSKGNPTNRFDSLIRTDDGGYAIVGTRLYF
jgi:hypothetical protein